MTIIVFILIVLVAAIINGIEDYNNNINISIEDSINAVEVPVISMLNNGNVLNFLVDSGANMSIIDSGILANINYEPLDTGGTIYGLEGNLQAIPYIKMETFIEDKNFEETYQVLNLTPTFYRILETTGIRIDGVLGNSFFKKYDCKIDFDNLIFYIK